MGKTMINHVKYFFEIRLNYYKNEQYCINIKKIFL